MKMPLNVTISLTALVLFVAMLFQSLPAVAEDGAFIQKTHIYKIVGETRIAADVYRADDQMIRPVVVWIHGGALIFGSRRNPPKRLQDLCRTEGLVLISIDYRLAPEVQLPAIIEDVNDAIEWIRQKGLELFYSNSNKIVITGGSAGGYLTMMCGVMIKPRPQALVSYWGYGNLDSPWYTNPSEHYCTSIPLIKKEDTYKAFGRGVITSVDQNNSAGRRQFYRYLRQNGLWTKVVTGFNPKTERAKITPYCPLRNITSEYPPILLIHGTNDKDVPYEESAAMAEVLKLYHIPHELITIPGGGHGLSGGDSELIAKTHARALKFIKEHLR